MNWKILPKKSDDLTEQLLFNRGIKTEKQKNEFFHPNLKDFEKDLKIPGIPKAIERIQKAIKSGELIIAYGDYDVDGIAGAAILYLGLTSLGAKVLPYIPHREKEGYGLSRQGLEFARDAGATVVITTDTGIVAFEQAKFAKQLGLDLIITDHHQTDGPKLPDAFATIHSLKLCGAANSWCLVKSLIGERASDLLDFVAVATISDMMSLTGVNRALVFEGLKKINHTERVGWKALFHQSDLTPGEIGSYEIGHIIAPRLNAMGRLEHAIDSLRLLCTKDPLKAKKLADLVGATNEQRKQLTIDALEEAKKMIDKSNKLHVISSKNWSSGIIGLVAGRVCDETGCSTVAIAQGLEYSKGSARAGNGVNIVELLRKCSGLLEAVGGHSGAAGFTIKTENIDKLKSKLEDLVINGVKAETELEVEAEVQSNKLSLDLVKKLDQFEPFGIDNSRPTLATLGMKLSDLRTVGEGKHLKGKVYDPERSRETDHLDFIGFGMGESINILENNQLVDLIYTLDADKWDGREKLQLKLRDLKIT